MSKRLTLGEHNTPEYWDEHVRVEWDAHAELDWRGEEFLGDFIFTKV